MKPTTHEKWTYREMAGELRWLATEMRVRAKVLAFFAGFDPLAQDNAKGLEQAATTVARWSESMVRRANGQAPAPPTPPPVPPPKPSAKPPAGVVFMVQEQFVGPIQRGTKYTTVRPVRKRLPQRGAVVTIKRWVGKPYRSKQELVAQGRLVDVSPIRIEDDCIRVGETIVADYDEPLFAMADGFEDMEDMRAWFRDQYGPLPFVGTLYQWGLE